MKMQKTIYCTATALFKCADAVFRCDVFIEKQLKKNE